MPAAEFNTWTLMQFVCDRDICYSSSTVHPMMFMAAPTRCRLPVISTWTWVASKTSWRRGGEVDVFVSGLVGGREWSLPAEHQCKARLRQLKVAVWFSFIGAGETAWSSSQSITLCPLITWPFTLSHDCDCSSSHACLFTSVLAHWLSNVTVRLVWSIRETKKDGHQLSPPAAHIPLQSS